MTTYFIKLILCSALFFLAYKLLFENEKMLRFNRIYLLLSIILSFIVPLLTIQTTIQILPAAETSVLNPGTSDTISNTQNSIPGSKNNALPFELLSLYLIITTLLLFRYGINLKALFSKILNNPVISYKGAKLVLTRNHLIPHSFLNYLFINDEDYNNGRIEPEVLYHELAHIQQKHSIDVLFIELVQAMVWFNPIFILYRKTIQLNHEFLADDSVINRYGNTLHYQHLLINKASLKSNLLFTSRFNYSITKKRLIMMTKSTSLKRALGKQMAVVPLLVAAIFTFSIKTIAQDPANNVKPKQKEIPATQEGVSQELLNEYEAIINKNKLIGDSTPVRNSVISEADVIRLKTIYLAMSKAQQARQTVTFARPAMLSNKPSEKQFEALKNSRQYAITIDDKKEGNTELNKYKPADFANFSIIYLAKTNRDYGKHLPLDVYLMTKEYHKEYLKRLKDPKMYVMITAFKKDPK